MAAMRAAALEPKRMTFVHADTCSESSMVLIEAVKGGAEGMRIGAPILLYQTVDGVRRESEQSKKIYEGMEIEWSI